MKHDLLSELPIDLDKLSLKKNAAKIKFYRLCSLY